MSEVIMSIEQLELAKIRADFEHDLLWGSSHVFEPKTENLVFAIIKVAGKQRMCKYDNIRQKAYKLTDTYEKGEEIVEYEFVRWARPMDV